MCSHGKNIFLLSSPYLILIYFFRCALHTNDSEINLKRILENAQKAKEDLGNVEIKFDPTQNIRDFYN